MVGGCSWPDVPSSCPVWSLFTAEKVAIDTATSAIQVCSPAYRWSCVTFKRAPQRKSNNFSVLTQAITTLARVSEDVHYLRRLGVTLDAKCGWIAEPRR